jgi:predicted transcriptional regulator
MATTVPTSARLSPEVKEALKAYCAAHERSESWVIEKALVAFLSEDTKPKAPVRNWK